MTLEDVNEYLCTKLLKQGFLIHRYYAFSTNSIYLKLDWGAGNSIRISDHCGYEHLKYKYVVLKNYKGKCGWQKNGNSWQYFCGNNKKDIDTLIEVVLADKINKQTMYNYSKLMEDYKNKIDWSLSFWKSCERVVLE